ncbi:hypothetical protein [Alkalihalobacillus sp. AL-G]|uniref:hypothetical protein n=1 Tax=Alkalihalobacillus sp. AL-G TaxID=2926399 RepID=UPI00272C9BEF|nr:hypothetical protein [Alkalihalobacillus sp. AL-G]WLD94350.1 hypothetical protein MOJ78_05530 [Alkalihalobacillus sp. AL-G]
MSVIIGIVVVALALAGFIDWRRKRNNNDGERAINPHAKPGEDSNHTMGDNQYMNDNF